MTFDPQHFLNLATNLASDAKYNDEARYRTAISRAYYAAYLVGRKKLELTGYTFSREENTHQTVIGFIRRINPAIGDMLSKLRKKRNDADYELDNQISSYTTSYFLSLAETVIEEANRS
jgi:uncharacterized protein (UPF0332 family)